MGTGYGVAFFATGWCVFDAKIQASTALRVEHWRIIGGISCYVRARMLINPLFIEAPSNLSSINTEIAIAVLVALEITQRYVKVCTEKSHLCNGVPRPQTAKSVANRQKIQLES